MNMLSRRQVLQAMGKGLAIFALVPFVGCDNESKKAVIESGVKSFSENLAFQRPLGSS